MPVRALLVVFALAGGVGLLKGLAPTVVEGSEYYWLLSYDHGFIKRGLVGTLFRPLLHVWSFDHLKPLIMTMHVAACIWIIVASCWLFQYAVSRERDRDTRIALTFSFLCLMCSQLMPTLAHDVGYVDVYLVSLTLAGFWLVLHGRYGLAALAAGVGPLIHEAFVFLWSPVAILLLWSCVRTKTDVRRKLVAVAVPVLVTLAVVSFHNQRAAQLAIEAAPINEQLKDPLASFIFGQTFVSAFEHMVQYDFRDDFGNFLISAAYFLPPAAAMLWAAMFCYGRRLDAHYATPLVALAATLCPLTIVAFAWDLSRFLVWSTMAAAIALVALGSPELSGARA